MVCVDFLLLIFFPRGGFFVDFSVASFLDDGYL